MQCLWHLISEFSYDNDPTVNIMQLKKKKRLLILANKIKTKPTRIKILELQYGVSLIFGKLLLDFLIC